MPQITDHNLDIYYAASAQRQNSSGRQLSPWDQYVPLSQIHPWDQYGLPKRVNTWHNFDQRRWKVMQEQYKQQYLEQLQIQAQERIRQEKLERQRQKLERQRNIRRAIWAAAAAMSTMLLLFAVYSLMRWGFGYDIMDRSGWKEIRGGNLKYRDYNGKALTGWQTLDDGQLYYFSEKGVLQTGWFTVDDQTYYWDEGKTGLTTIDGKKYYIHKDLSLRAGWVEQGEKTYYCQDDGAISTGWVDVDEQRYYFGDDGVMYTGWMEWEGDTYYFKENGRMTRGQVTVDDVNYFFTSQGKSIVMVNKNNPVPADYELELVNYNGYEVASVCRDALEQMVNDCRSSGVSCYIDNVYRSQETQNYLWWRKYNQLIAEGYSPEDAEATTDRSLMRAGYSEHHTGLAVDFILDADQTLAWMGEHCWDYGYIVRYPEGKSDITEIIYEPWHFRYVGMELAYELRDSGLCMEEYMQMLTEQNNA